MIGALLSLIPTIAGLFGSNSAHDKYSKDLDTLMKAQKMPDGAEAARVGYEQDRTRGYVDLNQMEQRIKSQLPETIGATKDFLTGPNAFKYIEAAGVNTNQQLQKLYETDNALKQQHDDLYKAFMGTTYAGYQNKLQDDKNQLAIAKGYNDVDKAAVVTKTLGGMGNALAGIADKDLFTLIAGLSKDGKSAPAGLAPHNRWEDIEERPADLPASPTPTNPYFTNGNADKSQLGKYNLAGDMATFYEILKNIGTK